MHLLGDFPKRRPTVAFIPHELWLTFGPPELRFVGTGLVIESGLLLVFRSGSSLTRVYPPALTGIR